MSTLENPYEWPFPQRTDLMAFQTISIFYNIYKITQRNNSINQFEEVHSMWLILKVLNRK